MKLNSLSTLKYVSRKLALSVSFSVLHLARHYDPQQNPGMYYQANVLNEYECILSHFLLGKQCRNN